MTSIVVLCDVRDGVGLAPRRIADHRVAEQAEDEDADQRAHPQQRAVVEIGGALADLGHLVLDALASVGNADAGRRRGDRSGSGGCRRGGAVRGGIRGSAGLLGNRFFASRGAGRKRGRGGVVLCGAALACGAWAAAGVSPAAARAMAHPINFIRTPMTWVSDLEEPSVGPLKGRLIGAAFRPLKRQFRLSRSAVEAVPWAAYSRLRRTGRSSA